MTVRRLVTVSTLAPFVAIIVAALVMLYVYDGGKRTKPGSDLQQTLFIASLALVPLASVFSILGGIVALWRYRRSGANGGPAPRLLPTLGLLFAIFMAISLTVAVSFVCLVIYTNRGGFR